jgi:gp16 family phage-associated protein
VKPHLKLHVDGRITFPRRVPSIDPSKRAKVRQQFLSAGISLREWAAAHDYSYETVKGVLDDRLKAIRGEAYRVAVSLGLRNGRATTLDAFPFSAKAGGRNE